MKNLLVIALFLAAMAPAMAMTSDTLVKFKGGIGVIPVSSVAGNASATGTFSEVNRNTVRTGLPRSRSATQFTANETAGLYAIARLSVKKRSGFGARIAAAPPLNYDANFASSASS